MKQKRENENSRGEGGGIHKVRHVDGDVPLSMQSKGEEYKDSSSKKEIEVGCSNKDSRSKAACGSKDLCGSKTSKENKESAEQKRTLLLLCYKKLRSRNSSERIEEMKREFEGCRSNAVVLNEIWRPAKSEIWETHQRPIFMGAGQYENRRGVGILMNKKWRTRINDIEHINERAINYNDHGKPSSHQADERVFSPLGVC